MSVESDPPDEVARPSGTDAWSVADVPPSPALAALPVKPIAVTERISGRRRPSVEALELVQQRSDRPPPEPPDLSVEMRERFQLGDFTGSLAAAELLLGRGEHTEAARRCAKKCREQLMAMFLSRLGSEDTVVRLGVAEEEVRWTGLDKRTSALLARVDGVATIGQIITESEVPKLDALRTLVGLVEAGTIRLA